MAEKKYRLIGEAGMPFDFPPEGPLWWAKMAFVDYLRDEAGQVCGVKLTAELGRGYGFNYGWQEFTLRPGEEFQFYHHYTDTTDGTWENDFFPVTVRLVEDP